MIKKICKWISSVPTMVKFDFTPEPTAIFTQMLKAICSSWSISAIIRLLCLEWETVKAFSMQACKPICKQILGQV